MPPSDQPVDAEELRLGLAAMRDALADAQSELQMLQQQLEEAARREADLQAALAELGPGRLPPGNGLRPRARQLRRSIERLGVRVVPAGILLFIWHNPLFDSRWYLERYPDVRSSKTSPERHYRRHGMAEGRDSNAFFDTSWYLSHYPDVVARGIDPLDHYHLFGAWEGRDPSPLFRTRWYLALNPDVRDASVDPLLHYLRHGALEGRPPRPARRPGTRASALSIRPHAAHHAAVIRQDPSGVGPLDGMPLDRPVALILDDKFPRPDRDAGSVLTLHYVRLFQDLGYHVHFVATQDDSEGARYRKSLAANGATLLDASTDPAAVLGLLESAGPRFAAVLLSGISVAGRYLDEIGRHCREARTIFLTHDLHFLREERAAMLAGDRAGMYQAAATRELEIHVARMADATIVVSSVEQGILEAAAPGARVFWCPLIQDVMGRVNGFAERSGVAFVGGYRHDRTSMRCAGSSRTSGRRSGRLCPRPTSSLSAPTCRANCVSGTTTGSWPWDMSRTSRPGSNVSASPSRRCAMELAPRARSCRVLLGESPAWRPRSGPRGWRLLTGASCR